MSPPGSERAIRVALWVTLGFMDSLRSSEEKGSLRGKEK